MSDLATPLLPLERHAAGSPRTPAELPATAARPTVPFRERWLVAQDGLRLFYRDYGDPLSPRAPLLCLTGLVRNSADYADLAERHAQERRVIIPEYRGRGRSDYDPEVANYHPLVYLRDVAHLMAATDLHRVVIVGTSLGGIVTMGLAVFKPTSLAAVVINDIGPDVVADGLSRIVGYVGTDAPQPDWDAAAAHLKQLLPQLSIKTEEGWRRFAHGTYRQGADGLLHYDWDLRVGEALRSQQEIPDLWPYFRALRGVPTLALRGAISDVLSAETFERMALAKPDLLRVTVPDSGHAPTLNEPEAAAAVDDFIRRF